MLPSKLKFVVVRLDQGIGIVKLQLWGFFSTRRYFSVMEQRFLMACLYGLLELGLLHHQIITNSQITKWKVMNFSMLFPIHVYKPLCLIIIH